MLGPCGASAPLGDDDDPAAWSVYAQCLAARLRLQTGESAGDAAQIAEARAWFQRRLDDGRRIIDVVKAQPDERWAALVAAARRPDPAPAPPAPPRTARRLAGRR